MNNKIERNSRLMVNVMKNNVLYVLKKIKEETQEAPCKKTAQKIIYLLENTDGRLGFNYGIHFYGPYSSQLNQEIIICQWEGLLNINQENSLHKLDVVYKNNIELCDNINQEVVDKIIEQYAKWLPSKLELLTTTLYVMKNITIEDKEVVKGVRNIKGEKYTPNDINDAIKELYDNKLIKTIN